MAETVHLIAKPLAERDIESIQLGGETDAGVEVIDVVETANGIFSYLVILLVPRLIHTLEEHTVIETHAWSNTDVLEEHERCRTAQVMFQTILPIFDEV